MEREPFVLFCAGEDSGDVLGESLVRYTLSQGLKARGIGGPRMQLAGLEPISDYETLPVSGFTDVLPRIFRLKEIFRKLAGLQKHEDCVALVCIDYPGFNLKLCARSRVPVLYVAPPQVWAWKSSRVKKLRHARLAVLFDFERRVYESHGLRADILKHPFPQVRGKNDEKKILLLPGSRLSQALRNMRFFFSVAKLLHESLPEYSFVVVSARKSLTPELRASLQRGGDIPEWLQIAEAPSQAHLRAEFYSRYPAALCLPGSATLELARSGVSIVVADVLDALTYFIGKHFVKTDYYALPNVLLSRSAVPECFFTERSSARPGNVTHVARLLQEALSRSSGNLADELEMALGTAKEPDQLMSEFLGQFLKRDAH